MRPVTFLVVVLAVTPFTTVAAQDSLQHLPLLTAEVPLHLEEHLDAARIVGSEVPEDLPRVVE